MLPPEKYKIRPYGPSCFESLHAGHCLPWQHQLSLSFVLACKSGIQLLCEHLCQGIID